MLPDSGWLLNPHLRDFNGVALNRECRSFCTIYKERTETKINLGPNRLIKIVFTFPVTVSVVN